jgi:hypothetical protein
MQKKLFTLTLILLAFFSKNSAMVITENLNPNLLKKSLDITQQVTPLGIKYNKEQKKALHKNLKDEQIKILKKKLNKILVKSYSQISNENDKKTLAQLTQSLKKQKELNSNNENDVIVKNELFGLVKRITSIPAIICFTSIICLSKIEGILTSEIFVMALKQIKSTSMWGAVFQIFSFLGRSVSAYFATKSVIPA